MHTVQIHNKIVAMIIKRALSKHISNRMGKGKAILLFGPRQSGKTTLVENLLRKKEESVLYLNGDEPDVREILNDTTSTALKTVFGKHKIVFIDEAQRIQNIGLTLKLCTDQIKEVQVIATGSSAFELQNRTSESLTGRKYEFLLLPLSFSEIADHHSLLDEKRLLEHRMIYGSYPEIVTNPGEEAELLRLLASSYLYKDILSAGGIKKPVVLEKLLKALALQVGSEVSYHELSNFVGVHSRTIESYIDLLEKALIIFRLPAFARNVRNEIKKGKKIYFYDNGVRNAVIGNFGSTGSRTDTGALFENYLVSERQKQLRFNDVSRGIYFWRTTQQQEIDYVEEHAGELDAFEFKWKTKSSTRLPKTFSNNYSVRRQEVITPKNYDKFLTEFDPE